MNVMRMVILNNFGAKLDYAWNQNFGQWLIKREAKKKAK